MSICAYRADISDLSPAVHTVFKAAVFESVLGRILQAELVGILDRLLFAVCHVGNGYGDALVSNLIGVSTEGEGVKSTLNGCSVYKVGKLKVTCVIYVFGKIDSNVVLVVKLEDIILTNKLIVIYGRSEVVGYLD